MSKFAESLNDDDAPTHPDGSKLTGMSKTDILAAIHEKLIQSGIDLDDIGSWDRVSVYGSATNPMVALRLTPSWEDGPQWPVIEPAKSVKINRPKARKSTDGLVRVAILPDPQVGYLKMGDQLVPVHDPSAISVAAAVTKDFKPDVVVHLGDFMDFAEFSTKFVRHPAFVGHTQMSLDAGHRILSKVLSVTPEGAETILMPGNHEKRLTDNILQNAREAFGLRRAGESPAKWPVISVPNLLRLDDLGITYGEAYPSGQWWLRDDIRVIHGDTVSSSGSSAATIAKKKAVSTIFGHVHRIEMHSKQWDIGTEWRDCITLTPGCLCATDGAVPSASSAINHDGSYVRTAENWNQGAAFLTFHEDGGPITAEITHINNGVTHFRGNSYIGEAERMDWEY